MTLDEIHLINVETFLSDRGYTRSGDFWAEGGTRWTATEALMNEIRVLHDKIRELNNLLVILSPTNEQE